MVATLTDVYYAVGPLFNAPRTSSMKGETNHLKLIFLTVGTTTAERFEETSLGWIGCRLILILSPPRSPVTDPPTFQPFLSLLFFLLSLTLARRSGQAPQASHSAQRKKWQPAANVGGEQTEWCPKLEETVPHRAVAPMFLTTAYIHRMSLIVHIRLLCKKRIETRRKVLKYIQPTG